MEGTKIMIRSRRSISPSCFGQSSGLPVYYRKLAGNISDVSTIRQLIRDLSFLEIDNVKLVMDRGFYSEGNTNALFEKSLQIFDCVKKSLRFVQDILDDVRDSMKTRAYYSTEYGINVYSKTIEWSYTAQNLDRKQQKQESEEYIFICILTIKKPSMTELHSIACSIRLKKKY